MAGLSWNGSMSCPAAGRVYRYNHFMISSLMGFVSTVLLWHPAVLRWGQRSRLGESSRVEFQYSAAYSVPWSPLHSSVNSFTMSFTLLLFTRSLQDRGDSKEGGGQRGEQIHTIRTNVQTKVHSSVCRSLPGSCAPLEPTAATLDNSCNSSRHTAAS